MHTNPGPLCDNFDRCWLITSTTAGSRLPGDPRGITGTLRSLRGKRTRHNRLHEPLAPPQPDLQAYARNQMSGDSVLLEPAHAIALVQQFQDTCTHRSWHLLAAAVMPDHFHCVVGVPADPAPDQILQALKMWGSRRLNQLYGSRACGRWWTRSGSTRKLPHVQAVLAAIRYVLDQPNPLHVWSTEVPELGISAGVQSPGTSDSGN